MSSIEDTWPAPDYDNGPPKHVHAIGVIALTYSMLQSAMDRLFLNRANSKWAEKYYYLLSEEKRSDAIKDIFKDEDPGVVAAIGNLVECFNWSRACRNILLHAESYPSDGVPFPGDALALIKRPKKGSAEPGFMALTLQELRDVADRMRDGIVQCMKMSFCSYRDRPEGVPEKYREYARSLPPKLTYSKADRAEAEASRTSGALRLQPDERRVRSKPSFPPMTLRNMRENGVRMITATCSNCGHSADVNVDRLPETVHVPTVGQRLRCGECGSKTIKTRPAWHTGRRYGVPG